ncbi:hypothetical protein [Puia sp.]|jgi:glutathione synthase/RimK-type ligase-like ATP-grasp enzyme|uniref:ATP-grasp domain-containing protein n=1 Tax=Puia sp. TaxID=2045100 RepID=UPI002F416B70
MILIIGIPSESPVERLCDTCKAEQIPYLLLDQRRQDRWSILPDRWDADNSTISDGDWTCRLKDFSGIYLRTMDHRLVPGYECRVNKQQIDEQYLRLIGLLDMATAPRIANRPSPMMSNNSKPYQAQIIRQSGLDIPDTLITNDSREALDFISSYDTVIYKSISGTRSIVKKTDAESLKAIDRIRFCPVQFQECIQGTNVRVHVIGTTAIATGIESDATDYRYAHPGEKTALLTPFMLSRDLYTQCITLSRSLNLPFSGIDLMITREGRVVCFEVNSCPGYSYFESGAGQPISKALAEYLSPSYL